MGDLVTDIDTISFSLNIKNQNELYQHFMPFVKNGGFFVSSKHGFALGDSVQLRLALYLVDELVAAQRTVIWVSSNGDSSLDIQGVGVQLTASEGELVSTIKCLLDDIPQTYKSTLTM